MNDNSDSSKTIQTENIHNYFLDFLPEKTEDQRSVEIQEFYLENHLENYANIVINIIIKLSAFFELGIYLTDFPQVATTKTSRKYEKFVGTDISSFKIEEWTKIIKFVIMEDISTVQILSKNPRFLISINGKLSNEFCQIPDNIVDFIKNMVEHEGLYLIRKNK